MSERLQCRGFIINSCLNVLHCLAACRAYAFENCGVNVQEQTSLCGTLCRGSSMRVLVLSTRHASSQVLSYTVSATINTRYSGSIGVLATFSTGYSHSIFIQPCYSANKSRVMGTSLFIGAFKHSFTNLWSTIVLEQSYFLIRSLLALPLRFDGTHMSISESESQITLTWTSTLCINL